ncbi:hypothetical protein J1770_gp05 [Gordonia phage EMoore]|uniref:Uncharacterized protein n=1 Tax=Gordonia phage EMoore TaxID=2656534 RepID=A0A649VU56_9CAUD|nr:hypothetical protein J1770_gp05 [Gordonia phage EMoore]QGJ95791.1 hypothetical protein SEA_EMOORE_5 [Gordonia phage EMoore]
MKRTITAAAALLGALIAAVAIAAAPAQAVTTDQYDNVRLMMCGQGLVELEFTNSTGGSSQGIVDLDEYTNGCYFYDSTEYDEYGGYVWSMITDDDGGPVKCAIWVNGALVSHSNDDSPYYSFATCY